MELLHDIIYKCGSLPVAVGFRVTVVGVRKGHSAGVPAEGVVFGLRLGVGGRVFRANGRLRTRCRPQVPTHRPRQGRAAEPALPGELQREADHEIRRHEP